MLIRRWKPAAGLWIVVAMFLGVCGQTMAAEKMGTTQDVVSPVYAMAEGYRIGAGDVLSISVWKNSDLTKEKIQVLPDGRISFPLVGELEAAGLTVAQLTETLRDKLVPFLLDPQISVEVKDVNSQLIYVIGRVAMPGQFVLKGNTNVLQALALAGGLTSFAKRGGIKVFRSEDESVVIYEFDYDEVTEDNKLEQNIWLKRGDVVVVP